MQLQYKCPGCKLLRYPQEEIVVKDKKRWLIKTCRVCKYNDIEPYNPKNDRSKDD